MRSLALSLPHGASLTSITNFFFKPASARPLAALRIGLSSILLVQAFLMHKSFLDFFAPTGFVQGEVSNSLNDPSVPRLNGLVDLLSEVGIGVNLSLTGLGIIYVASLIFLLCGSFTRMAAFLAWFLNWSFMNTGYSGAYGADMYAHFFLFYLIWMPSGDNFSLDRFFQRVSGQPSYQARLGLRVLQLHMCISYFASGVEKASGPQWWNGEVLWSALNTPGYSIVDFHWLAELPFLPMLGGWLVMAIETFYIVMVWPQKTRPWWVLATCLLHLGIAIFLNLPIFGILMCIPTLALFAVSAEPSHQR
jgi:hypothetical protein